MSNDVKNPKHYQLIDGLESIEVLARAMTPEQWLGYCLGNILKYRMRAGKKDDLQKDICKADNYESLYHKYKVLCIDYADVCSRIVSESIDIDNRDHARFSRASTQEA